MSESGGDNKRPAVTGAAIAGYHHGAWSPAYHVLAVENRAPSRLPGFDVGTAACLLTTPHGRATEWAEYLVTMSSAGASQPLGRALEHFLYVLEGDLTVAHEGDELKLPEAGAFAYLPAGPGFQLRSDQGAEFIWVKRPYRGVEGVSAPPAFAGARHAVDDVEDVELLGSYERQLLPADDIAFDFTMKLLSFDPGIAFTQVEIHDEDHGIYFTAGRGVYLLDTARFEVGVGDYMYLAPYCPQHFVSTGESRAEYLLYKPVNRDGFEDL